jgi:hypothetical protein
MTVNIAHSDNDGKAGISRDAGLVEESIAEKGRLIPAAVEIQAEVASCRPQP